MYGLDRLQTTLSRTIPAGLVVVGVGLVWFAISVWNFDREIETLATATFPVAAFVLTGGLSLGIVYVGYRITQSSYDPVDRWSVAGWALAGLATTTTLQTVTLVIRAAEGRPIGEPQFPLLVVGGVGLIAGAGIGSLVVDVRRTAQEAKEARDGMAFANSLLRHDVRNGLQVILGQADLVARFDDEQSDEVRDRIESQVEALFDLTENASAVTSVLTGDAAAEPRDLTADIESAVATIDDSFPSATVETDLHDQLVVEGTEALRPAIGNVLNNAVEHTGSDPTVRVQTAKTDGQAVVRIADDGPGIPEDQRSAIFERGVTSDGGSNGLGLHIVSTLIERSGGSIRAEDSELGGVAFVIELPLSEK